MGHSQTVKPGVWEESMATSTHFTELARRHRMLEDELTEALQHPSVGDFTLAELKRRKLQLKDEMARLAYLENGMPTAAPTQSC
jgi:hypothetical protein